MLALWPGRLHADRRAAGATVAPKDATAATCRWKWRRRRKTTHTAADGRPFLLLLPLLLASTYLPVAQAQGVDAQTQIHMEAMRRDAAPLPVPLLLRYNSSDSHNRGHNAALRNDVGGPYLHGLPRSPPMDTMQGG